MKNSNLIRQGEAVTLNQVIEILQAEESAYSTMQQIQDYQKKPIASIHYQAYDSRSKKSKNPSNEQNSSSTESKRQCFRCGEPFSRKHMKECRAQNAICNGCGIKGHLKKCCKKSGNFPKDSNRQNQSSSTGSGSMNFASTLPQTEADFFDEKGLPKEYRPPAQYQQTGSMFVLKKIQNPDSAILVSEDGAPAPAPIPSPVPAPAPAPVPSPDFPFQEFPLTEVVTQSQIDYPSISDARESSNSSRKATKSTDLPLKSGLDSSSHEEMRDSAASDQHIQSSRGPNTISIPDNSNTRKSIPGTIAETPDTTPDVQSSKNRSVMPTDIQALTVLQDLISDDSQAKNTPSTQRKGEDTRSTQRKGEDETF